MLEPEHVFAHHIVGEGGGIFKIGRDLTAVHDDQTVGQLHDLGQIRRDQQHRDAGPRQLDELLADELRRADVNASCRLVCKNENRIAGELTRHDDLLDITAREHADLLLAEGFIEPHFFAGFSGGRKSILPGVCDKTTVLGNHCGAFIASPYARTGILEGNPLHRDMVAAAEMAKLAYIVNVVIDEEKKTVAAFAGDFRKAHEAGVAFLRQYCEVQAVPGDIVVTSNGGAPLDQNIYQSVKGLTAAEASAKEGAVLIMCAELADGTGGEGFYTSLRDCETPAAHFEQCVNTPQSETIPDQWESQILARILMKHRVIFVSRPEMEKTLREMKLDYAPNLETAMAMAKQDKGENASVTLIPNGISVMVKS